MTMMLLADWDGNVKKPIPALAKAAEVTIKECEEALAIFLAPDPYSTTPDKEGRRIEKIEGGWHLINHSKYREMGSTAKRKEYMKQKSAEYRAREKEKKLAANAKSELQQAAEAPPLATDEIKEFE